MTLEEMLGLYPSSGAGASMQYLRSLGQVPSMLPIYDSRMGAYSANENRVFVNPRQGQADMQNTLAHETAHAADTAMADEAWRIFRQNGKAWLPSSRPNQQQMQFSDAYRKMRPSATNLPTGYETALQRDKEYRTSDRELRAFGVGNTADPRSTVPIYQGAPHLDPTMATEFEILLGLAQQANRSKQ